MTPEGADRSERFEIRKCPDDDGVVFAASDEDARVWTEHPAQNVPCVSGELAGVDIQKQSEKELLSPRKKKTHGLTSIQKIYSLSVTSSFMWIAKEMPPPPAKNIEKMKATSLVTHFFGFVEVKSPR